MILLVKYLVNWNICRILHISNNITEMTKELTIERLAEAIIKTTKEVRQLKSELEKVQAYLREQHKLKKQLNNKI